MMRRNRRDWPRSRPKVVPPPAGIRMRQSGSTWWGQRWIEALEQVLLGDMARLARGRTYARAGRVHDLAVRAGSIRAKVTGSRVLPYRVTVKIAVLTEAVWNQTIARMAEQAQFAAELLAGQMPRDIDAVFRETHASLFPTQRSELVTACSCPDWGDPCKHVAATHYVLGEAFDHDPFLLFELRGRTKAQVLDELRAARAGNPPSKGRKSRVMVDPGISKVTIGKLEQADYDRAREPLPTMHLSFEEPRSHGVVLRQLGLPAAWHQEASPAELLEPLVRAAADQARRLALAEPATEVGDEGDRDETQQTSETAAPKRAKKRGVSAKRSAPKRKSTRAR